MGMAEGSTLGGLVPGAITSMIDLYSLVLSQNELSGSIPDAIISRPHRWKLTIVDVSDNMLSGSICNSISIPTVIIASNWLTGTLPPLSKEVYILSAAENLLEGSLGESFLTVSGLHILDLSGNGARGRGLHGPLPPCLGRARGIWPLEYVMAHHNSLMGAFPHLPATTLQMLLLHDNELTLFSAVNLVKKDPWHEARSFLMLHNNRLSCKLSRNCSNALAEPWPADKSSLIAIGNHLRYQDPCPDWISPLEKDKLLWTSENEGRALLVQAVAAGTLFAVSFAAKRVPNAFRSCGLQGVHACSIE